MNNPSLPGNPAPRDEYTRRLSARRAALAEAVQRHIRFGNLRVAALLAVFGAAYAAFSRDAFSGWWLLAPAAAFFWTGAQLEAAVNARRRLSRAVAFYDRALARLDERWAGTGADTGVRFLDDEHLYARDLDLFGDASLFELLNAARTRIGEDTLAAWLKTPAPPAVIRVRQEAVSELAPLVDLREDLAVLGENARTGLHAEPLAVWGEAPPRFASPGVPGWVWPLSFAGVIAAVGLIAWLAESVGMLPLAPDTAAFIGVYVLSTFIVVGIVLWRFQARISSIFHDADEAAHDLGLLSGVIGRLEAERFASARLVALRAELDVEGLPPSRRIAQLNTLMYLVDLRHHILVRMVRPLLLWDIHLAYALERWRRRSGPALRRWLTAVGEIEALSSLAGYRFEHPGDVFPVVSDGPPCVEGEALGHPLLPADATVRNDVRLCDQLRVLVVSGSNMSGKSTLLRTVGINVVLALAGGPVRARSLRVSPLGIGASIRIQDSLQSGVSRFYAEILRIGAIMRRANETPPVLFLIDELLHGTNSHDRRIGAEAIVRSLVARGAIGLVTTHDLSLAHVADALGAAGANVHFEDSIEDGRMRFDYRMRPGIVEKSNALALMRSVGLDV
jgi:hypothetical protein